jgi:hypothetical protein
MGAMKIATPLFLLCWLPSAQSQPPSVQTKGACSPVATGDNNTFTINCGIGKAQGDQMLKILNKILANQLDTDAVMAKLDEILKAVNPNLSTTTYDCDGNQRIVGPAPNVGLSIGAIIGDNLSALQHMEALNDSHQYENLLTVCMGQLKSAPEWLTPRLFCGLAYLATGNKQEAQAMLAEYESKVGPAYNAKPCSRIRDFLRSQVP